jgi:hypothetical protein
MIKSMIMIMIMTVRGHLSPGPLPDRAGPAIKRRGSGYFNSARTRLASVARLAGMFNVNARFNGSLT